MNVVDIHVHLLTEDWIRDLGKALQLPVAMKRYKLDLTKPISLEQTVQEFDEAGIGKAIVLPVDFTSTLGVKVRNDLAAEAADKFPNKFINFCSIDPHLGAAALAEMDRCAKELHAKGLKLQPAAQNFYPNDKQVYPIYEKCVEYGWPILFHSGVTWVGFCKNAGPAGGYGNPIYLDDVAVDFPELRMIGAHFAWPWYEEMLAVAFRNENVFFDLSAHYPRSYPERVVHFMNKVIPEKVLFGSDYPTPRDLKRLLSEFQALGLKPESAERILYKNAQGILGL